MQLTPKNLVMACGAMLAGGAVFGVITTLAPAVSLPTATGATPTPTATATADGLGDEEITYPASSAPDMSAWPTPIATGPAEMSPSATPSLAPASPSATATARASTESSASPAAKTKRPARTGSGATAPSASTRAPRPRATPPPSRREARTPAPAPAPASRRTTFVGGWQAPSLHVGANTIVLPRLTSRAKVRVTVGCSPSSACHVTGDQLVIDPSATTVTVTWWAPANAGYPAWQVSRGL